MSLEANKFLARRANELWASDNTDNPDAIFSPDYINHQESDVAGGVSARDLEEWKALVAGHRAAFGECRTRVLMQIAEGHMVATRWEFAATQTGPYLGHPATGQKATWTGVQIDKIRNSRIVESWVDWDMYRQFRELGMLE